MGYMGSPLQAVPGAEFGPELYPPLFGLSFGAARPVPADGLQLEGKDIEGYKNARLVCQVAVLARSWSTSKGWALASCGICV